MRIVALRNRMLASPAGGARGAALSSETSEDPEELARRNAAHLHEQLATVNAQGRLVRELPTESQVAGWIREANTLPVRVEY